jgi:uncharacterized cupredoxin-like copper-binding protein
MRTLVLAPLAAAALFGAACDADGGSAAGSSPGDERGITAALADTSIVLADGSAPAGPVSFDIANDGTTVHEFEVLRTEIAADALPVESGVVQTSAEGIEIVDEVEEIAPGSTAALSVDLAPGAYVVICNIPTHYDAGMFAPFAAS